VEAIELMDGSSDRQGVTAGPPPAADPQDPLPESDFRFRRYFSYGLILLLVAMLAIGGAMVGDAALANKSETAIEGLIQILWWNQFLIGLIATYYLLAPSAEQITKMIQVAGALKAGVNFRSSARADGPSGSARSAAVAGRDVPGQVTAAVDLGVDDPAEELPSYAR
jgi:hypothetical protein